MTEPAETIEAVETTEAAGTSARRVASVAAPDGARGAHFGGLRGREIGDQSRAAWLGVYRRVTLLMGGNGSEAPDARRGLSEASDLRGADVGRLGPVMACALEALRTGGAAPLLFPRHGALDARTLRWLLQTMPHAPARIDFSRMSATIK